MLAALILLGTGGFFQIHVARTADYDSLLVMFTTLATFHVFFAFEALGVNDRKSKDFYVAAASIVGGIYTKGVAGLLMLPGYLVYIVWSGKFRTLIACRAVWLSGAFITVSALLFLGARELAEPGFGQAMWQQDVAMRFGKVFDRQAGSELYYVAGLLWPWQLFGLPAPDDISTAQSAFPWSWLLPAAVVFGASSSRPFIARASVFLLCCLIGFLVVISAAEMKNPWYVAPIYPVIAVLTALGINEFGKKANNKRGTLLRWVGKVTLPASIALGLVSVIINLAKTERSLTGARYSEDRQLHYFMRSFVRDRPDYASVRIARVIDVETPVVTDGKIVGMAPYHSAVEFYVRELQRIGIDAQVVNVGYFPAGDEVIIGCGDAFRTLYQKLDLLKKENRCFALGEAPRRIASTAAS